MSPIVAGGTDVTVELRGLDVTRWLNAVEIELPTLYEWSPLK